MRAIEPRMLLLLLPLAGCYGSTVLSGDGETDDATAADDGSGDTPADVPADTVPEADATPEVGDTTDVSGPECTTDDDCVVALNQERCCAPDPVAVPRSRLAGDHCLHELGTAWTATYDDCWRECYACGPMTRRYYSARCEAGVCVGVEDTCEPSNAPPSAGIFDAAVTPEGGWEQYRGRVITLHGWPTYGPDSSACTPDSDPCFSTPVQRTLACNVTLRGSTCGVPWSCSGTECDPHCTPEPVWGELWLDGYLVDADVGGWELWPITGSEDCAPRGPHPEGTGCTPFGTDDECADGLFCYYWGDVVFPCVGTCRPEGTECVVEADCPTGDTCYRGYCEWCCPG